jgi:hypothetical protein
VSDALDRGADLNTFPVPGVYRINATKLPIMPRGAWLWPDTRTGMEWADKHDERL